MIYSLCGDSFREWVSQQVKDRNDSLAEKRDLMIAMDPEIAAAFGNSANISSKYILTHYSSLSYFWFTFIFIATKGRGVHILKAGSKRRRTQADMREQFEME